MDQKTYDAGMKMRRQVAGGEYVDKAMSNMTDFNKDFQRIVTQYCWGEAWGDDTLTPRERSILNLGMIAALESLRDELMKKLDTAAAEHQQAMGRLFARFSAVAADNPLADRRDGFDAATIARVGWARLGTGVNSSGSTSSSRTATPTLRSRPSTPSATGSCASTRSSSGSRPTCGS